LRLLKGLAINSATLFGIAYLGSEFNLLSGFQVSGWEAAIFAAVILGLLNMTIAPLIKVLALPITCLTFGLFTLVINAAMMLLTARIVTGFEIASFLDAVILAVIFAVISSVFNSLINSSSKD